ncbi:MAG: hypothetical protein JNK57_18645 [Planctomycetaceae bacterium]|nr:hypothetical protein [Planctomycetaceae bacterium]
MNKQVRFVAFVCISLGWCVNALFGQDIPPDEKDNFDRVAKFKEIRNRSFDENLAAITTEDGGLGNRLVMGVLTNTLGWKDYFQPVLADPRMRRMHEHLAVMDDTTRQAALTKIVEKIVYSLELIKTDDIAAADFRLAHGTRCLLLLLCDYDDPRFETVVDQWLAVRAFVKEKYPGGLTIDENGNKIGRFTPPESIDEIFLYNVYFQKLVRLKGRQEAERQITSYARMADLNEPYWFIKEQTWTTEGKDMRVFAVVLGSGGAGRQLTLPNLVGAELLKALREDVAKLDSK